MRVLLSTYGSRGDVEPMVGLAVQPGALGAEVRVPLVPIGQPVRLPAKKAPPPSADLPPHAAESSPPGSTPSPRRPRNVMRRSRPA